MKLNFLIVAILIAFFAKVDAQNWDLVKEVTLAKPAKHSVDRYNHVFVADQEGNLRKYDDEGNYLLTFSPQKLGAISLLECWNTIRIFLFYRDFQSYLTMDRFLTLEPNYTFDRTAIGFARMATLSQERNIWVFDDTDFTLKKYNPQYNRNEQATPLELLLNTADYDINFMREYQNQLYINDFNAGILVFDNMGTYKKKLPFKNLDFFGFKEDELYFVSNGELVFFNLYKFDTRSIPLPEGKAYRSAQLTESKLILFHEGGFDVYKLK